MEPPAFVDCHSHVCPSGDDGARSVADGAVLCRDASRHGTAVLFATPHVWPHLPLSKKRECKVRAAFEALAPQAGVELRLGFELTPDPPLLREEPERYRLGGTDRVLMEVPFSGPTDDLVALAEHVERWGLKPVIAHPERTECVLDRPELAHQLAERWLLQVNASSLLGNHGPQIERLAWRFVEQRIVGAVASDGHRLTRPARLDAAFALVAARIGPEAARPLFDGSALGVLPATGQPAVVADARPGR
ncbi:MAG: CpsB/CapC family capsule biosynthesis tyrosine phosphatase [Gaiellaceae bacterium]